MQVDSITEIGVNSSATETLTRDVVSNAPSASDGKPNHPRDIRENDGIDRKARNTVHNFDDINKERKRKHLESMKRNIPVMQQVRTVLFPRWITINWLLIAAPVGIALNFTSVDPLAVFLINFIAIIPLAGLLSFVTEEIAMRVGEVLGGLLNASFGYVSWRRVIHVAQS